MQIDRAEYQNLRRAHGIGNRTINMGIGVLHQMLKRAKRWTFLKDDVKALLFRTASSRPQWEVVYYAAVLAANTTCRSVELKHLRWTEWGSGGVSGVY